MLNHEEILTLVLTKMPAGEFVSLNSQTAEFIEIVSKAGAFEEKYLNLFQAAPIMYQTLDYQLKMVDKILAELRMQNQTQAILPFEIMRESIVSTMDAAVRGVQTVADEFRNKKKLN